MRARCFAVAVSVCVFLIASGAGAADRPLAGLSVTVYWPPSEQGRRVVVSESVADDLAELGVETIRMVFWSHGGEIPFDAYDTIIERLQRRGIGVLGLLDNQIVFAPREEWATDDYRARFVDAVKRVVSRYKDRIHDWEVWNEEDYHDFLIPPEPYAQLLTETYEAIKAIDPDATVASGGLSSTWDASGRYLRQVYEAPATQAFHREHGSWPFDVVCIHPYHWKVSPDTYLEDALKRNILLVMAAHGDGEKPIWLTEIGWNVSDTHPTGLGGTREENELTQALHLIRLFDVARSATRDPLSDTALVQRVYWFEYRGEFGLEDLARTRRASWDAYRTAVGVAPPGVRP